MRTKSQRVLWFAALAVLAVATTARAEEEMVEAEDQSRESMANDQTASQWTFQSGWEAIPTYYSDTVNGAPRPSGKQAQVLTRIVAPINSIRSLPRLSLRIPVSQDGNWGHGNSDLFWLFVPLTWSTGRLALGPQLVFPASSTEFGSTKWAFGGAGGVIQRLISDKLLVSVLVQGTANEDGQGEMVISPSALYSLPAGFYVGSGEWQITQALNRGTSGETLFTAGARVGKLFISPKDTWNFYVEFQTSIWKDNWTGAAPLSQIRFNIAYTIPVI